MIYKWIFSSINQNTPFELNIFLKHQYSDQFIYNFIRKKLFVSRSFVQNLILFCEHLPFFVFTICCAALPCKRLEFKPIRNLQYKTDQQWPTCLLSTCWVVVLFDWSEVSQQNQLTNIEPPRFKYIASQGNASLPNNWIFYFEYNR